MEHPPDYVAAAAEAWLRAFPGEDLAPYAIVLRLIRGGRMAETRLSQVTAEHGFAVPGDYEVLSTLRRAHPTPLRPLDLADRVMISAPGITGRLDRLEEQGLVERTPHPTDRRASLIRITPAGVERADRTFESFLESARDLARDVPATQRERLAENLQELLLTLGDAAPAH